MGKKRGKLFATQDKFLHDSELVGPRSIYRTSLDWGKYFSSSRIREEEIKWLYLRGCYRVNEQLQNFWALNFTFIFTSRKAGSIH